VHASACVYRSASAPHQLRASGCAVAMDVCWRARSGRGRRDGMGAAAHGEGHRGVAGEVGWEDGRTEGSRPLHASNEWVLKGNGRSPPLERINAEQALQKVREALPHVFLGLDLQWIEPAKYGQVA
jgi:hypothetical protein